MKRKDIIVVQEVDVLISVVGIILGGGMAFWAFMEYRSFNKKL